MALIIEDNELASINLTPTEIRLEIAILFYQKGKLSIRQARLLSGLERIEFIQKLAEREIAIYDTKDLEHDLKTLGIQS